MKKNIYVLIMCILGISIIHAKPITPATAKSIATSFYTQLVQKKGQPTATLAYTETSSTGDPIYYAFNINTHDGFVIVAAEDAAHPIIGYSNERQFTIPTNAKHVGISSWLNRRKEEILSIRKDNLQATEDIVREWAGNFNSNAVDRTGNPTTAGTMSVAPLTKTTWDQPSPYNAKCPSNCLTGCVATTMSQIMKFWSYPTKGTGSSSYNSGSYGTLSATYSTTTYNWSNMPLNVTSANADVATIMSQAGISVDMTYGTSESSAYVISTDNAICAQTSYTKYFGYDPSTIQGLSESNYTTANWLTLLENELSAGRPIQYAGQDVNGNGGHTWVCDGYDVNGNLHMNWGWSGQDNGYFALGNLNANSSYNFSNRNQAIVGLKPLVSVKDDAGISTIVSPSGKSCASSVVPVVSIENYGSDALTSCTINYNVDNGTSKTYNWTGSLANGQSATVTLPAITAAAGTHTLVSSTSNPNGTTDGNTANDQSTQSFTVTAPVIGNLPLAEGFESSASLPSGWTINNPDNDAAWTVSTTVAHTGSNSIGFNNCNGDGSSTDMTGRKDWFYTTGYNFSSVTTASLSFDVGYVPANDGSKLYTDSLVVLSSTDCGITWNQIYKKGGTALATAPAFTITSSVNCTTPTSSQWRTDVVNVASLAGSSNVMFAFENISDYGNWLFLDNINIASTNSTTGISSTNSDENITLYPNPAHTSLYVNVTENTTAISVTDLIGHTVIPEQRVDGSQQVQSVDISNLSDGIYFMRVNSVNNQAKIIRFIKN